MVSCLLTPLDLFEELGKASESTPTEESITELATKVPTLFKSKELKFDLIRVELLGLWESLIDTKDAKETFNIQLILYCINKCGQ